jgi:hypothetical protein
VTSQNEILESVRNLEATPFTGEKDTKKGLTLSRVAIIEGAYRQRISRVRDAEEKERLKEGRTINERD